jgi:Beta-galactosidase/beta-glucuronidase
MARVTLFVFVLQVLYVYIEAQPALDGTWTVVNDNGTYQIPGRVPGGIYTDLSAAGIITENIYYCFNDLNYCWVSLENWTYYRLFDVPEYLLQMKYVYLTFYGIDTIASIYINEQHVTDTDNMFVKYSISIKEYVQQNGSNLLEVKF